MQFKVCLGTLRFLYDHEGDATLHANLIMCLCCSEIVEECVNQHLSKKGEKKEEEEQDNNGDYLTPKQRLQVLLLQSQTNNSDLTTY